MYQCLLIGFTGKPLGAQKQFSKHCTKLPKPRPDIIGSNLTMFYIQKENYKKHSG